MATVQLKIQGRSYDIACDAGQEQRVAALGAELDRRVKAMTSAGAASQENHALVLAALVMADELDTLKSSAPAQPVDQNNTLDEDALAETIDTLADRILQISERVDRV